MLHRFRQIYGSHPLHLLTLVAGFALFGYVVATIKPSTLWNTHTWWQSILVWFAAAIIAHDLVLFPIYALLDRVLVVAQRHRAPTRRTDSVPIVNYVRVPALGAGLTLLLFLPGIIKQGAPTYVAATGQTQDPFLGRWFLLAAAMFAVSATAYAVALFMASRKVNESPTAAKLGCAGEDAASCSASAAILFARSRATFAARHVPPDDPPDSGGDVAAVDGQDGAVDLVDGGGGEEHDGIGNVGGGADSA